MTASGEVDDGAPAPAARAVVAAAHRSGLDCGEAVQTSVLMGGAEAVGRPVLRFALAAAGSGRRGRWAVLEAAAAMAGRSAVPMPMPIAEVGTRQRRPLLFPV